MKNCLDCVYHTKENCSGDLVRCEYPLPNVITMSVCMFTDPYHGKGCPLLKTKSDLAKQTTQK